MSIIEPAVFLADARMIARELMSLRLENARLRERLDAFTKAFREYAVDEGDCFVCGWPINEFQQKHGEKCVIAAALQEGSDES